MTSNQLVLLLDIYRRVRPDIHPGTYEGDWMFPQMCGLIEQSAEFPYVLNEDERDYYEESSFFLKQRYVNTSTAKWKVACPKCGAFMPSHVNECGNCTTFAGNPSNDELLKTLQGATITLAVSAECEK